MIRKQRLGGVIGLAYGAGGVAAFMSGLGLPVLLLGLCGMLGLTGAAVISEVERWRGQKP